MTDRCCDAHACAPSNYFTSCFFIHMFISPTACTMLSIPLVLYVTSDTAVCVRPVHASDHAACVICSTYPLVQSLTDVLGTGGCEERKQVASLKGAWQRTTCFWVLPKTEKPVLVNQRCHDSCGVLILTCSTLSQPQSNQVVHEVCHQEWSTLPITKRNPP